MKELFLYILFPIGWYLIGRIHEMLWPNWPIRTRRKEPAAWREPEPDYDPLAPPDICELKGIMTDAWNKGDYKLVYMCEKEIDRLTQERKV